MKEPKKTFWHWAPRILSILFAAFISIFALDVFGEYDFPAVLLALLIHLIPTILVVIMIILAWRWELIGTIVCLGLALFYIFGSNFDIDFVIILLIPGPMIIAAVLWLVAWLKKRKYLETQAT